MLKNLALKKIVIISLSLIILLIIYLFPNKNEDNITTTLNYVTPTKIPIYLIDSNDLIARFEIIKQSDDIFDNITDIIEIGRASCRERV